MKKVFCWGTFDCLHAGHLEFLRDAKKKGDSLSVVVIPDDSVHQNKGRYPRHTQQLRVEAIENTGIADRVISGGSLEQNIELILSLKPDVFVFGYDQKTSMEERLKSYLSEKGLNTEHYLSNEFAGGIHSRHLRKNSH